VCSSDLAMIRSYGSNPADIQAGIGPSIGPNRYQVGEEVVEAVQQQFGTTEGLIRRDPADGTAYLDLWAANRLDLERAGVGQNEVAGICTAENTDEWFSHRAEKGRNGRFGAVLCLMTIAENVARIREQMAAASARSGRDPAAVTLIAVSKTHPASAILEAAACGLQHFGENRVEESTTKIPAVGSRLAQSNLPLVWHMIGHIQSRKAKEIPPLYQVVHSVDTLKLAERLSREVGFAYERGGSLDVLLEVNISGEASKAGFAAYQLEQNVGTRQQLEQEVAQIAALPGLKLRGLMTMAPIVEDMEQTRPVFAGLAALRATLENSLGTALPDLSMGMTDDFPVAIEEGATLVRIGRAIFGEREKV